MAKEAVLARIEADLERGDLGKARDRLHTLVHQFPDVLGLRARLAEVYYRLQFPTMAGRYWYLEERRTAEVEAAIAAFERSCGGDPLLMLSALKFRGDPNNTPSFAHDRLLALRQAVHDKYGFFPDVYTPSRMLVRRRGSIPREVLEARQRYQVERLKALRRRHFFIALSRGNLLVGRYEIHRRIVLAGVVMTALAGVGLFSIVWWSYQALR